jgi:ubiquinol-cytochrome c reductase cytochrome b subunit
LVTLQVKGTICWNSETIKYVRCAGRLFGKVDYTYALSAVFFSQPVYVTTNQLLDNQQVTNGVDAVDRVNILVDTSEAECPRTLLFGNYSFGQSDLFYEWLAGLIDGDGCFLVSKDGYVSCEIIAGSLDEPMLFMIKNRFGGSIKPRSGTKAVRWRLHHKEGMTYLVNSVNGLIRNTKRVPQFQRVCEILNIKFCSPLPLHPTSGWYSGFFDADGTITFSLKGKYPQIQLRIGVTNRYEKDVIYFKERFLGSIYYDRSQNGYYSWSTSESAIIQNFIHYTKNSPLHSIKAKRFLLVPQLYKLKRLGAHKSDSTSALSKSWLEFKDKWDAAKA